MLRRQVSVLLAFLLLLGGLGYGLVRLYLLRSTAGDIYPAYSTLRADPLGAKALLDSLNALPGLSAWRNYQPLPHLRPAGPVTLVYLGLPYESKWEQKELEAFETLMAGGSRAVFAFAPEGAIDREWERVRKEMEKKEAENDDGPDRRALDEAKKLMDKGKLEFSEVAEKWGFGFEVTRRGKSEKRPAFLAEAQTAARGLEASLPWHSELHFTGVKAPWKVLYTLAGQPVLIERAMGNGSIVLAADSYFLSNEGLHDTAARAPKLVAWLIGAPHTIVFDEEHLGTSEQSGVATLTRKFRLEGLAGGLVVIALLFLWQNLVRFVPPQAEAAEKTAFVSGRGSREGFLNLLRRSISTRQLLNQCLTEWRRTFTGDPRAVTRAQQACPDPNAVHKGPEVVAAYAAIAKAVSSKAVSQ